MEIKPTGQFATRSEASDLAKAEPVASATAVEKPAAAATEDTLEISASAKLALKKENIQRLTGGPASGVAVAADAPPPPTGFPIISDVGCG